MNPQPTQLSDILFPKQQDFYKAYKTGKYDIMMFGGAMGGGKSWLLAVLFLSKAVFFGGTVYGVFRKNLTTLKRTTYQTFRRVAIVLGIVYEENRADMFWKIKGLNGETSIIWFMELDSSKDPDYNKVKSFECTDAGVDEANEIDQEGFNILTVRKGRINPFNEHCFIYLSCNPDKNWVKTLIYDPWREGKLKDNYFYLPSLPTDNPNLSAEYIKSLQDLPENEKQRYLYGNWDFTDDPNQLIPYQWLVSAVADELPPLDKVIKRTLGVDVANEGDDNTIMSEWWFTDTTKYLVNSMEVDIRITDRTDISGEIGDVIINYAQSHSIGYSDIQVDAVGVGVGVRDYMRGKQWYVNSYKGGESVDTSTGVLQFRNLRAYSHWMFREGLQNGIIKIWSKYPRLNQLNREAVAQTYSTDDKVIMIEKKSEIKKKIGNSPDTMDSAVMGYAPQPISKFAFVM